MSDEWDDDWDNEMLVPPASIETVLIQSLAAGIPLEYR